jgi:tetratricopeptide (TPR) repeat protein
MRTPACLTTLLLAAGCASNASVAPDAAPSVTLTAAEQKNDPLPAARKLIDKPEAPGNLDHAAALLQYHAERHPEKTELHVLLAEAHSRAAERLDLQKDADKASHARHRTEGLKHAEQAVKLNPGDGVAHYWLAALQLHAADAEQSLGRANAALKHLEQAEKLAPKTDEGGPSRLRGKVLRDKPGIVGGSVTKAIECYRRSLELAPNCIITHLWLAEAYMDQKQHDLARKELEWVVAAKPRPGREKEDAEDKQKAQELLKKVDAK